MTSTICICSFLMDMEWSTIIALGSLYFGCAGVVIGALAAAKKGDDV